MRAKHLLLGVMMLSFSLIIILAVRLGLGSEPAAAAPTAAKPEGRMMLVAAAPLPAGTLIRAQDVRWAALDSAAAGRILRPGAEQRRAQPEAESAAKDKAIGAVLRSAVGAGEPLVADAMIRPGEAGFLAAVVHPGKRAVPISVAGVASAGGLISPGDRVDLVLTQSFADHDLPAARRSVSETVAEDLRVLAIDRTVQGGVADTDGRPVRTMTVEVTPRQAEKIAVATELGKLSVTLRSLLGEQDKDGADDESTRPTWAADVSAALRDRRAPVKKIGEPRPAVLILRGSIDSTKPR